MQKKSALTNVVVIIPTYNERENIDRMIDVLENDIFPQIKTHEMKILVADDTSPDKTAEVIKEKQKKWKNISLLMGKKEGLGSAYARAMKYVVDNFEAEAVIEFDADFQHEPQDIIRLINAMDEGYDYVIGSRYIKGGSVPKNWALDRRLLSSFGGLFARIIWLKFDIHDITAGLKLTKTWILKKIDLSHLLSKQFAYKMELLHAAYKMGAKVKEIPITFKDREIGVSKINKSEQFESLYVVLVLALRDYERKIKFLIVGGAGFVVQVVAQETAVFFGLSHSLAAGFGAEVAILSNFLWNHLWTFSDAKHSKGSSNTFVKMLKFNFTSLGAVITQTFAVWLGEKILGINVVFFGHMVATRVLVLFPTIIFIVIPLNYILYNKVVWKTQNR
jgi:dolichol-phosphate mannosyltransferase